MQLDKALSQLPGQGLGSLVSGLAPTVPVQDAEQAGGARRRAQDLLAASGHILCTLYMARLSFSQVMGSIQRTQRPSGLL